MNVRPSSPRQAATTALLSVILLLAGSPVVSAAQEAASVSIADPIGDLVDLDGMPAAGHPDIDIASLEVAIRGGDLIVRFTMAGDIQGGLDATGPATTYTVSLDTDSDGLPDATLAVFRSRGFISSDPARWRARLYRADKASLPVDDPSIDGKTITVVLPFWAVSESGDLRFKGTTEAFRRPDPDGATQAWFDYVPDSRRMRRLRGAPSIDPDLRPDLENQEPSEHTDVSLLRETTSSERTIPEIRADLIAFVSTRPETNDLLSLELGFGDGSFEFCLDELATEPFEPRTDLPMDSGCVIAYLTTYVAYVHTGHPDAEALLRDFVGATVSRLPEERHLAYRASLDEGVAQLELFFPALFATSAG